VALSPWCTTTTDVSTLTRAWAICDETGYQWWDCLLLASAVGAACDLFLTEDLQHNRRIAGLRIVDPFRSASLNDIMG
jgi:predicted nucleic acid-binding protein